MSTTEVPDTSDESSPRSPGNPSSEIPHHVKMPSKAADLEVVDTLKKVVSNYQGKANYCCGGSIPISLSASQQNTEDAGTSKAPTTSPPTIIRWDIPSTDGLSRKIVLPLSTDASNSMSSIEDLLTACTPATFGVGGDDILDESYRKAGKLERAQFSTDFHPHDYGILDAISQILLPDFNSGGMEERAEHRGVLAELYKLNIYSGPSGMFKAHVDTPRGATQFGSLVVCLAHPHEGGQLRVSHKDHSTSFDWSKSADKTIQWAAFYGDCEHEVLTVNAGHRITLTYNLYVTEQIGGVLQQFPTADASLSPLYETAKRMLEKPGFLKNGGVIGFYCAHQYAHSRSESIQHLMPYALKGIDVALFGVFKSLGLKVVVRPLLDFDPADYDEKEEWQDYQEALLSFHGDESYKHLPAREEFEANKAKITRAGRNFHAISFGRDGEIEANSREITKDIQNNWPYVEYADVLWLNEATELGTEGWEVAYANVIYGNQAEIEWYFSHAVIFVTIPKESGRALTGAPVA